MKKTSSIILLLITFPIRLYLMWYLLKAVGATGFPMFIFWASVPFSLLAFVLYEIGNKSKNEIK